MEKDHLPVFSRVDLEKLHERYRQHQQPPQQEDKLNNTDDDCLLKEYIKHPNADSMKEEEEEEEKTLENHSDDMEERNKIIQNENWHQLIESYMEHVQKLEQWKKEIR